MKPGSDLQTGRRQQELGWLVDNVDILELEAEGKRGRRSRGQADGLKQRRGVRGKGKACEKLRGRRRKVTGPPSVAKARELVRRHQAAPLPVACIEPRAICVPSDEARRPTSR